MAQLRSPERLDEVVHVTRTRAWLAAAAGLAVVVVFFVWATVATIPDRITVGATMIRADALAGVLVPDAGIVTSVLVKPGDSVETGDMVAALSPGDGSSSDVNAPISGVVQEVLVVEGDSVMAGDAIAIVIDESSTESLQAVTYVGPQDANALRAIDTVTVQPSTVDTTMYGALVGRVSFVSQVPASLVSMTNMLGSSALAMSFSSDTNGLAYLVVVDFGDTLEWTNGSAPSFDIIDGTLAQLSAIISDDRPIDLILG